MLELLKQIPEVVWAALLASLLTLSGVVLSNRNSRSQTLAQLDHDSNQRNREREMNLRREVYLQAAEAIARGQNILTRLTDLNLSEQEMGAQFSVDSSTLAKIQIVSTNETVQAVSAFQQELASAYLELILKRVRLLERKRSIELLTEFIDRSQAEQNRLIDLMKKLNLEGNADQRLWKVIGDNFEFQKEQHKKYMEERNELWAEQNKAHLSFAKLCFLRFVEVSKLVPPAVFASREELELPIDKEAYLVTFNENIDRSMKIFQSFLEDAAKIADK